MEEGRSPVEEEADDDEAEAEWLTVETEGKGEEAADILVAALEMEVEKEV